MHILKGFVVSIGEQEIEVSATKSNINHIKRLGEAIDTGLTFRLDKDEFSSSTGILYQNLVNFLTLGKCIGRFCSVFVQYDNPSSSYLTPHRCRYPIIFYRVIWPKSPWQNQSNSWSHYISREVCSCRRSLAIISTGSFADRRASR
jgi:hypothetical protein